MTKVDSMERFADFGVKGKFGKAWECGEAICGQAICGNEEIEGPIGKGLTGGRWGIWQKRTENGKPYSIREKFYIPKDPKSAGQLTQRNKFRSGMTAWGGLTQSEKEEYNKRGSKIGQMGQNIFMREYLNSN